MTRAETKNRIPYMLIDTDFYEKPENLEAIDRFGDIAPAAIQRVCFKLINERDARLKKSQVLSMWRATGTTLEIWGVIIEYYIQCGWLLEQEGYLSSARVKKERDRVERKRSTMSANAKQRLNKSSAKIEQEGSISPDTDTDTDTDTDLKKNGALEIGLIKIPYADHVHLTDFSQPLVKKRFRDEGLSNADIKRAVEHLDRDFTNNTERRYPYRDNYKDLISWPLDKVKEQKLKEERNRGSPKPEEKPRPNRNTANF